MLLRAIKLSLARMRGGQKKSPYNTLCNSFDSSTPYIVFNACSRSMSSTCTFLCDNVNLPLERSEAVTLSQMIILFSVTAVVYHV